MCRIIVASGNIDVPNILESITLMAKDKNSFHELNEKNQGRWKHADGWGVAYQDKEGNFVIAKSSKAIFDDPDVKKIHKLTTNFLIAHVRKKAGSEISIKNTHPFKANHAILGECIFCHNGFIEEEIRFDSTKYKLRGKTDSEKLFYSILSDIAENQEHKIAAAIQKNLHKYRKTKGTNIVLATKEKTYVAMRKNELPKYYGMMLGKRKDFLLISSEKLKMFPDIYWTSLQPGDVVAIDNGTTRYSISKEKVPLLKKIAAVITR